mmetsp:Transcript_41823/g.63947  ORF Transcript_41823/g.63947 Transcript_41823/m.63947 type:complete len:229 (-) Transcript_41823:1100-1786(-)
MLRQLSVDFLESLVLQAPLLHIDVSAINQVVEHLLDLGVRGKRGGNVQLREGLHDEPDGQGVLIADIGLHTQFIDDGVHLLPLRRVRLGLRQIGLVEVDEDDLRNDLHQGVGDVGVFLEDLQIDLNDALSERLLVFLAVVLAHALHELVGQLLSDQVTAHLEHLVHRSDVPVLGWRELLTELTDLQHEVLPGLRLVRSSLQIAKQLFDDGLDILLVSHFEEQVESPDL